ncbi:MAG: hypothetical protein RIE32_10495 [Phycisphaerales bacterium]
MIISLLLIGLFEGLAQDGRVPPARVDPTSIPVPASTEPVLPRGTSQEQSEAQESATDSAASARGSSRIDWSRQPATIAPRQHQPASIFTDEAYRHARVRSLLVAALEGRV